jgi:hypothetical protein
MRRKQNLVGLDEGNASVVGCCCVHIRYRGRGCSIRCCLDCHHHHRHGHNYHELVHLARSVFRVTAACVSVSSVSQLFSFPVDCSGMILRGYCVVVFFAGVRAISFCIHVSCLVCIQSVVRGIWSRLSYGH